MPNKPLRPCKHPGCRELVVSGYCEKHRKQEQQRYDKQRGTASQRGYDSRWAKCSKLFLSQPENVFCKLQLPGCANLSECTDHINPPNGPNDPKFWDPNNWQGACIHCNSVKGHNHMKGEADPFEGNRFME